MSLTIKVCESQFTDITKRYDSNYALVLEELNPILFWIKTVDLPGLSIGTDDVPYEGVNVQNASNALDFGHTITPTFFVDEKLYVIKYVYDWIVGWRNGSDYVGAKEKQASIVLFDNSSNNIMGMYHFTNMFASSMTGASLKNKSSGTPLELNVTLKFDEWSLETKNN